MPDPTTHTDTDTEVDIDTADADADSGFEDGAEAVLGEPGETGEPAELGETGEPAELGETGELTETGEIDEADATSEALEVLSQRPSVADIPRALEAIFMIADEPQTLVSLATAVGAPIAAVRQSIEGLVADYDGDNGAVRRGFELREVGGGWRVYVRPEFDDVVRDFVLTQNPTRLSQAALETLAVIAYKQPISRGSIASIRAVNVDSVVRTLLGRGLITEAYTDSETGAIHYATTDLMLTQLGINSIDELPHISPLLADGSDGFDDLR